MSLTDFAPKRPARKPRTQKPTVTVRFTKEGRKRFDDLMSEYPELRKSELIEALVVKEHNELFEA